jgi:hypothetical protein
MHSLNRTEDYGYHYNQMNQAQNFGDGFLQIPPFAADPNSF